LRVFIQGAYFKPGQTCGAGIVPESETGFFIPVADVKITFVKDESGKVSGLTLQQMGRTTKAKKIE